MAASLIRVKSALLVLAVSFPPLRIAQFPLLIQSVEICTNASGLASKITPITPIGTEIRVKTRS